VTDIDALLKEAAEHEECEDRDCGDATRRHCTCGDDWPCLVARLAEALREKTDADQAGR